MSNRTLNALTALIAMLVLNYGTLAIAAAPTADAGADQTVAAGEECVATVTLTGTGSDPDGTAVTYSWAWTAADGPQTASGASPAIVLGIGTTEITLTVTDGDGETATDTVSITVEDQTPPVVTATASPSELWPPNHKMVPVTLSIEVTDNCNAPETVTSKITAISSNEPENGIGDGNTAPDWEITGDLAASLRAERAGPGTGRIYTLTIESTDANGNVTVSEAIVTVPHDQGGDDDDDGCIEAGDFTTYGQASWGAPADGENAGAYLAANFAAVFPEGVTIGAVAAGISGNSATFTSAASVEAFLPQGGVPAALALDHTDPLTTEAGELAGQVLALTLNVKFDLYDPEFSDSDKTLASLVLFKPGSLCDGKTVEEILTIANTILGGGTSEISAAEINDCVTLINENFEGGAINGGFLIHLECALSEEEWEEAPKALREKEGEVHDKLMKIFDKDRDGKLKSKEKGSLRKAYREYRKKSKSKGKLK